MSKKKGGCMGCLTTILAIPLAFVAINFLEHPPTQKDIAGIFATATPGPSDALMLATVQLGYEPDAHAPLVIELRDGLHTLSKHCGKLPVAKVADLITVGVQQLNARGIKETQFALLHDMNVAFSGVGDLGQKNCPDAEAALITLKMHGMR